MPHSHHSHSGQFCKHASGSLEEIVREAIRQGFEVYGLTEHVPRYRVQDLYPEEEGIPLVALATQFDAFLMEAHRLKEQYANEITLMVGLETEFVTEEDLAKLEALLKTHDGRIEYLVGSIHHVNATPIDFDFATFRKAVDSFAPSPPEDGNDHGVGHLFSSYFDAQHQILVRFHPEVIGHFDLCRLYNPSVKFSDYPLVWEKLERNVKYAISYGALFELNAAALRKGWNDAYPGEDVANLIIKYGGRFALSDDSHGPHAVGLNYLRLAKYMRRLGLQDLWVLECSSARNAGGRLVQPCRVSGNWWEHEFWGKLGFAE